MRERLQRVAGKSGFKGSIGCGPMTAHHRTRYSGERVLKNSIMTKIRVCNVNEEGRFAGPARRIVQVASALKPHNIETHVFYPKYDSEKFSQELLKAGIANSALSINRLTKEKKVLIRYILFFIIEIYRLSRLFKKHNFDLIHVNGSYQIKGALAARLAGIPSVWHFNDTLMDSIIKKICIVIGKYCSSGFIVAGDRVRNYYIRGNELEKKPCIEIHAPVDTTMFDPQNVNSNVSAAQVKGRRIVTVAGINPTKGLEYFIEMASTLLERYNDVVFFIAGAEFRSQRHYHQVLKKLIASKISQSKKIAFTGMIDNVPSFLLDADICVFTSIAEASPTAIWEALSMGKAIVTTDVGSVNQYIEDGISGFIVPVKDVDALCRKVEILLENSDLRIKMGVEARSVAKRYLDISIAAEKHATIYRKILSESSLINYKRPHSY